MPKFKNISPYGMLIFVVTVLGFCLRIAYLQHDNVWWDEIVTATRALFPLTNLWNGLKYQTPSVINCDCSPPLHHILIHFSLLFGKTSFFLKLPNVIFGTLTIPMVYLLGSKLLSRRCGLLSALYLALCLYHFEYSRDARWYALFYFLTISAFYFFMSALEENKIRHWLGYTLATTGMLYTSYMALPFIASQPLALGLRSIGGDRRRLRPTIIGLGLSLVAAGLLYAPWIQGQINAYLYFHEAGFLRPFDAHELLYTMTKFIAPTYNRPFALEPFLAAGCLLGALAFIVFRRFFALACLVLWTAIPVVAAYKAAIGVGLNPKYIMSLLFSLVLLAGACGDLIASWLEPVRPGSSWRQAGPLLLGVVFIVIISIPNFVYSSYWRPGRITAREMMSYLVRHHDAVDYLLFDNNKNFKAVTDWYMQGIFQESDAFRDKGYKRCYLLFYNEKGRALPKGTEYALDDMAVRRVGLVNRAPLLIEPQANGDFLYHDDFNSLKIYNDIYEIDNIAPDVRNHRLSLYDPGKDGSFVYVFQNTTGRRLASFHIFFRISLERVAGLHPDAVCTVTAEGAGGTLVPLARFNASDFPSGKGYFPRDVSLSLPSALLDGTMWRIRLVIQHGQQQGEFYLSDLRFQGSLKDGAPVATDFAREYLAHIQANSPLTPFLPGVEPFRAKTPYVFALEARDAGGTVASPEDLPRFLAEHPGARPVYTLKDPSGRERFVLYDPFLKEPFWRFHPGRLLRLAMTGPPQDILGLKLSGRIVAPRIDFCGSSLLLPLRTPPGTVAALNAGSDGLLTLKASYSSGDFNAAQFYAYDNIRHLSGADAVTCATPKGPCFAAYRLESHYPMRALRVVWYPSCFGEQGEATYARLRLSLDGGPYQLLDQLSGDGTRRWLEKGEPRVVRLTLPHPATTALLRLELSGDAAQISTPDGYPFVFEARLDTRQLPSLAINPQRPVLIMEGDPANAFGILPSTTPFRFYPILDRRK